jgi:uncharacterized protein YjbI with pentapeptide repeats
MNELVARWLENPRLRTRVLKRLQSGKKLHSLVGTVDGRADLRGFVFPAPRVGEQISVGGFGFALRSEVIKIKGAVWDSIDFTGATLDHVLFTNCTLRNLKVHQASFIDSGFWGCRIVDSQFTSTDMRDLCVSSDKNPSTWERTVVELCDLRGAIVFGGSLDGVEFRSIKSKELAVKSSSFRNVTFSGVLDGVLFDNRLDGKPDPSCELAVDFSSATLREVDFRGWRFSDVALPVGFAWFPKQLAVLTRVSEVIESQNPSPSSPESGVVAVCQNMISGVRDETVDGYFNPSEWRRYDKDGATLRLFEDTLNIVLGELGLQLHLTVDSV